MRFKNYLFIILLVLFVMLVNLEFATANMFSSNSQEIMYKWFQNNNSFFLQQQNITLYSGEIMYKYYKKNDFHPVWIIEKGIKRVGQDFINVLEKSRQEGLFPYEYNLSTIKSLILQSKGSGESEKKRKKRVMVDLLLTDAFFIYISDMMEGRLDISGKKRIWVKGKDRVDYKNILTSLIQKNDISIIRKVIKSFSPRFQEYKYLKEKLAEYRNIVKSGGWPILQGDKVLKSGDTGKQVKNLRERLQKEPGQQLDLTGQSTAKFDEKLQRAVFNFQKRYGLILTGKVDKETRAALNLTAHDIANKIVINLERLRWLSQDPGQSYVIVNIPEFKLRFVEKGKRKREERVIVGTKDRKTSELSTEITGIVFNPRWYIPHSIAIKDFLPRQKRDNSYLKGKNIRVYEKNNSHYNEIEIDSVEWEEINKENFNYYLWQESGPWNSLGDVIFQSPNDKHIYIHDTPDKYLFSHNVRSYSSGCVRIQNALEMAKYFVKNYTEMKAEDVERIIKKGREVDIPLKKEIPLHFVYMTTWINDYKKIKISRDIYNKDEKIEDLYFSFK